MGKQAVVGSATIGALFGVLAGASGIAIAGAGSFAIAGPLIATFSSAAIGAAAGALVGGKIPDCTGTLSREDGASSRRLSEE